MIISLCEVNLLTLHKNFNLIDVINIAILQLINSHEGINLIGNEVQEFLLLLKLVGCIKWKNITVNSYQYIESKWHTV